MCKYARRFIVVIDLRSLRCRSLFYFTHFSLSVFLPPVLSVCRAFKINELKTEVTNRLAMLEKRVECKCVSTFHPLSYFMTYFIFPVGKIVIGHLPDSRSWPYYRVLVSCQTAEPGVLWTNAQPAELLTPLEVQDFELAMAKHYFSSAFTILW